MESKPLLLLGSARKNGDTYKLVTSLFAKESANLLDLLDFKIYPYSYSGNYPADDQFLEVLQQLLQHTTLIFATPVYWYAMSGGMKIFFDRLTDGVTINKAMGRNMKGKATFLLAVGSEEMLPVGFEAPFSLTSDYFDMHYKGCYYCSTKNLDSLPKKEDFLHTLASYFFINVN